MPRNVHFLNRNVWECQISSWICKLDGCWKTCICNFLWQRHGGVIHFNWTWLVHHHAVVWWQISLKLELKGSGTGNYYMSVGYSLLLSFPRDRLCFKNFQNFLYYISGIHNVAWREAFYWKWDFKNVNDFLAYFYISFIRKYLPPVRHT